MLWLEELKRITRSGAISALSVIGEKLRATNMPMSLVQQCADKGFASFVPVYSDLLSEFSHQEYYKEAFHTIDYIAAIGAAISRFWNILKPSIRMLSYCDLPERYEWIGLFESIKNWQTL